MDPSPSLFAPNEPYTYVNPEARKCVMCKSKVKTTFVKNYAVSIVSTMANYHRYQEIDNSYITIFNRSVMSINYMLIFEVV